MAEPTETDPNRLLDAAIKARDFEIELFWKRSLFFWGFIAAAFLAFLTAGVSRPILAFVIAGFGLVCSFVWTLANRGSKYWFENWEHKVYDAEESVIGDLFRSQREPQGPSGWLSGRRFSVTRLTIALSDFTTALWFILFVSEGWRSFGCAPAGPCLIQVGVLVFLVGTVGFCFVTVAKTRHKK